MSLEEIQRQLEQGEMNINYLDGEKERDIITASYFADMIKRATNLFMYQLLLGGHYATNKEDKMIIGDNLKIILDIISKYEVPREGE